MRVLSPVMSCTRRETRDTTGLQSKSQALPNKPTKRLIIIVVIIIVIVVIIIIIIIVRAKEVLQRPA